ncbi:MAG: hypothetical protein C5B48_09280 [Candidatus Rokuibacteriota bacterium]|nr:MAG: hypothetical protein C5B48_09280 [Candidatus Rokubacteria bacterium]
MEAHSLLYGLHASCLPSRAELSRGEGEFGRVSLQLDQEERLALIRALYVVKDNWWLDEIEEHLLAQLESQP